MGAIKTTITYYYYDISDPEQAVEYQQLRDKLDDGRHWLNCISPDYRKKTLSGTYSIAALKQIIVSITPIRTDFASGGKNQ